MRTDGEVAPPLSVEGNVLQKQTWNSFCAILGENLSRGRCGIPSVRFLVKICPEADVEFFLCEILGENLAL